MPGLGRYARRIEGDDRLDVGVAVLDAAVPAALRSGPMRDVLSGRWLGHSLHPLLTDLPIGFWTSATVLDLAGGRGARPAARRLVALGVLSAVPTAVTGASDWSQTAGPVRRVGVAHALANTVGLACYLASWRARRRERWARGTVLGLLGGAAASVGGFLGGDLALDRAVTRDGALLPPAGEEQDQRATAV